MKTFIILLLIGLLLAVGLSPIVSIDTIVGEKYPDIVAVEKTY